jgi:hypothetical protein
MDLRIHKPLAYTIFMVILHCYFFLFCFVDIIEYNLHKRGKDETQRLHIDAGYIFFNGANLKYYFLLYLD